MPNMIRSMTVDAPFSTVSAWRHDAVAFQWKPPWPMFPSFPAILTVRPEYPGSVFNAGGFYEPPGGIFGRLFDRAVDRRLAIATMEDLLRRLQHEIRRRHAEFVSSLPTIEELHARERQRVGRSE